MKRTSYMKTNLNIKMTSKIKQTLKMKNSIINNVPGPSLHNLIVLVKDIFEKLESSSFVFYAFLKCILGLGIIKITPPPPRAWWFWSYPALIRVKQLFFMLMF